MGELEGRVGRSEWPRFLKKRDEMYAMTWVATHSKPRASAEIAGPILPTKWLASPKLYTSCLNLSSDLLCNETFGIANGPEATALPSQYKSQRLVLKQKYTKVATYHQGRNYTDRYYALHAAMLPYMSPPTYELPATTAWQKLFRKHGIWEFENDPMYFLIISLVAFMQIWARLMNFWI